MAAALAARRSFARGSPGQRSSHRRPTPQAPAGSPSASDDLDLLALLGDLSDAISVVTVVHRALEARVIAGVGDEEVTLRYALTLLRTAYSAFDLAFLRLSR
jgi:hypothetical protein